MKDATATASRAAGGCAIDTRANPGWPYVTPQQFLVVSCSPRERATLTYTFPIAKGAHIQGTPWCHVAAVGATVDHSWNVSSGALRVTVTVTDGTATLSTVSAGYYTR